MTWTGTSFGQSGKLSGLLVQLTKSARFEKLLDGVDLSKRNSKSVNDGSSSSTKSNTGVSYPLVVKDAAARVLLLLQYINNSTLAHYTSRAFTARDLVALLNLSESYRFEEAPRARLRTYIARHADRLAMQVTDYDDFKILVQLLQSSQCSALARAFFRLEWDKDAVNLLHLHHISHPWDMPADNISALDPDIFEALVYVESSRSLCEENVSHMKVVYSKCEFPSYRSNLTTAQLVFMSGEATVVFGEETPQPRFFRR